MSAPGAFEPAGYTTREDTILQLRAQVEVAEAEAREAEHEAHEAEREAHEAEHEAQEAENRTRQLRRETRRIERQTRQIERNNRQLSSLLARQNATINNLRSGRFPNHSANMPTRTGDLFLNTSLEEPATYRGPVLPPPNMEALQAEIDAEDLEEAIQQREHDEMHERARQQTYNDRAEKCADRLREVRVAEQSTLAVFKHALGQWKEAKPDEMAKFIQHFQNASIAASSSARIWDIVEWFGEIPREVGMALRAVQKHYHKEAAAQVELKRAEERCGGWSSRNDLDPEILTTVAQDRVRGNGDRSIFGLDRSCTNIETFHNDTTQPGEEKRRLHNILANLEIRKTLLNTINYHGPKVKPRYIEKVTKFGDTLDCSIVQWCSAAVDIIELQIQPNIGNDHDDAVQKLSEKVLHQVVAFSDAIDKIKLWETMSEMKTELMPLLRDVEELLSLSPRFQLVLEARRNRTKDLSDRMLRYEFEHGIGILGTTWKTLAKDTIWFPER